MRVPLFTSLVALSLGCSEAAMRANDGAFAIAGGASDEEGHLLQRLRVDVHPAEIYGSDGDFRALAQSSSSFQVASTAVDLAPIDLRRPVLLEGTVLAERVTPTPGFAGLPVTLEPAPGQVLVNLAETVQAYQSPVDDQGRFGLYASPLSTYRVAIVPTDPVVPVLELDLPVGLSPPEQSLEIPAGVAIYGRVFAQGEPLAEALVVARTATGVVSAPSMTDASGRYELRVLPDQVVDLLCLGRSFQADPELEAAAVEVGASSLAVDFSYNQLSTVLASGRVASAEGTPLAGVRIRLSSDRLNGYEVGQARSVHELSTAEDGTWLRQVLPGLYTLEVLPDPADEFQDEWSSVRMEGVRIAEGAASLGLTSLPGLSPLRLTLSDRAGQLVPSAEVRCVEVGGSGRNWSSVADDAGEVELRVGRGPLSCSILPPGDRLDLPQTWLDLEDASQLDGALVVFPEGLAVRGTVRWEGNPEAYALVDVVNADGRIVGSALTDDAGAFEVRVPALNSTQR
jgi:hypothetical protein